MGGESTSSPSNVSTSTFAWFLNTSRAISTRSSIENIGAFSAFFRIATAMRSNRRAPRVMMSTWPFVSGSNDPG